jgi:uncharacterized protein (TIGR01777 family)
MRIAITGSSGLIGTALTARLRQIGHVSVPVVRRRPKANEIGWDPAGGRLDRAALTGVDAVVNLTGAGLGDHRWTDDYKREIRESRVAATTLLATTLASMEGGPRILVSGSAVGYYGTSDETTFDETSPPGDDFLARVCADWEAATQPAADAGLRVVTIRTGVVLASEGGALAKLLPLFRFGLGGRFGNGRQWFSWITLDDHVGAVVHALERTLHGPVNLTAPAPVRNAELTETLGRVLHRPTLLTVPRLGPATILGGDRADALLYTGQRVVPRVLEADGYRFAHPELEAALRAVLGR